MSGAPSTENIIAELEAGVAAMDAEITAIHDRRVEIVGATDDMRRRTEALARSRFVIAEQLAQLKDAMARGEAATGERGVDSLGAGMGGDLPSGRHTEVVA